MVHLQVPADARPQPSFNAAAEITGPVSIAV